MFPCSNRFKGILEIYLEVISDIFEDIYSHLEDILGGEGEVGYSLNIRGKYLWHCLCSYFQ